LVRSAPSLPSGFYIDFGELNHGTTSACGADLTQLGVSLALNLLEISTFDAVANSIRWGRTGGEFAPAVRGGLLGPSVDGLTYHWGDLSGSVPRFAQQGVRRDVWQNLKFVPWLNSGTDFVEAIDSCTAGGRF